MTSVFLSLLLQILLLAPMCSQSCHRAEYLYKGECCPMCPAGTFVKKDCSEFRSTSCEPCPDGTYQEEPTGRGQCQRCRMCAADQPASDQPASDQPASDQPASDQPASDFYKSAVDKALGSRDGVWDLLAHCCAHRLKPGLRKFTVDLTYDLRLKHSRIVISKQTALMRQRHDTESQRHDTESQRHDTESQRPVTERDRRAGVRVRHVFCEQQLRGLCYWELQWDGTVGVGVCYKGSALDQVLGCDHRSWGVFCSNQPNSCLDFTKSAKQARIPPLKNRRVCQVPSQRMAVYLDWVAGTLSFYSVMADGEQRPVTTFTDSFTEPLVPLFWLQYGSVTLCDTEGTNQ
uniref:B30.2/SPRY domain-containing protein n=1 Tax=Knipowitschia caucasica TaxID=637954 RepID=A0AAV2M1W4_KNICA